MARRDTTLLCENSDNDDSGWESASAKMWKNLENVAVDVATAASEEGEEAEKSVKMWKGIYDKAIGIAVSARCLHDEQSAKDWMGREKSIHDTVVFMHAEVLAVMEIVSRLFKNPLQKEALQQRVDRIRQVIQALPSPNENTPPAYEPESVSVNMARREAKIAAARLAYEDALDESSGWKGEAAKLWINVAKAADDLSTVACQEKNDAWKIPRLWDISDAVWNVAYTAKRLRQEQTYHFSDEKEKTMYDLAVFMHTEVLSMMDQLIGNLPDSNIDTHYKPCQKKLLQKRMTFIRKDVQALPSPTVASHKDEAEARPTTSHDETKKKKMKREWKDERRESSSPAQTFIL